MTRVFVVDDTPQMRRMLEQMLTLDDFEVVGLAASGETAVSAIDETDPDVVVIDYKMPGLDGLATARLIREHRPEQAIILYTAYLDDVLEREAGRAGVALCVGKIEGISTSSATSAASPENSSKTLRVGPRRLCRTVTRQERRQGANT